MKINKIICGDCLKIMKDFPNNSIDTVITDPPYNLSTIKRFKAKDSGKKWNVKSGVFHRSSKGFMGKEWDNEIAFQKEIWQECLRIVKPGATLLCFGGTRTYHRLACAIEDAGWVLKDCIMWLYGSGFPKATDIKKSGEKSGKNMKLWNGWKSHGLKPAYEPILVAMKPNEGSYAENALKHGVAGLNIDGGRIPCDQKAEPHKKRNSGTLAGGGRSEQEKYSKTKFPEGNYGKSNFRNSERMADQNPDSRFPANVILDEEVARLLDLQSGKSKSTFDKKSYQGLLGTSTFVKNQINRVQRGDEGGASRFFYVAKASRAERNMGCEGLKEKIQDRMRPDKKELTGLNKDPKWSLKLSHNNHPTVKPLKLMEYLCLLTKTPTGGIVLDPFAGSGSTGMACKKTKRDFILIEKEKEYCSIAEQRIRGQAEPLF